ncbi:MAG TPA: thiamine phosphate synthase [Anaeromyxobacteraceae bacterium]
MSDDPRRERAARLSRLRGLYAIVGDDEPVARAEAAVDGGAAVVQVRMKRAPAGAVLEATRRIVALAAGRALVLVNDRPDLALLAGADGVHLGEEDLPVPEARRLLGEALLVGRTARTLEAAQAALAAGADHVGYGPVFPSLTKPLDVPPRGLEALAATCAALPAPVVAISGVTLDNVAAVARAGAAAAAVIGDLFDRGDPRARAAALAAAFARGARGEVA